MPRWLTLPFILGMFAAFSYAAFWYPEQLLKISGLSFISGWFLLMLACTPAGAIRLGGVASHSFGIWLFKTLLFQSALIILFVAFIFAFMGAGPQYMMGHINLHIAIDALAEYYPNKWGLFPWSLILFWGFFIAYFTYVKKGVPHIYHSIYGVVPKFLQPAIKTGADGCLYSIGSIALGVSVAASIMLWVYTAEVYVMAQHFLMPALTAMVLTLVMPLFLLPVFTKRLKKGFANNFKLNRYYTLIVLLLVPALLIAGFLNHVIVSYKPELANINEMSYVQVLVKDPKVRFASLFWSWWLLWVPIAGSYFARISQGRTIRQFVFGFFLLPLFFYVTTMILGKEFWFTFIAWLFKLPTGSTLFTLGIVNLWIIRRLTRNVHSDSFFSRGFMPQQNGLEGRLFLNHASKTQGLGVISNGLFGVIMSVCMLHCIGGWYSVQIQLLAAAMVSMILIIEMFLIFVCYLYRDKLWLNNQNIPPLSGAQIINSP